MEEDEKHKVTLSVTVKPLYVERAVYWLIIIILAILLMFSYFGDSEDDEGDTDTVAAQVAVEQANAVVSDSELVLSEIEEEGDSTIVEGLRSGVQELKKLLNKNKPDVDDIKAQLGETKALLESAREERLKLFPIVKTPSGPSCSDGTKNQDESDVDCGGSCNGCAAGKDCDSVSDCAGDYCTNGVCTNAPPAQLSGKLEITLTDIEYTKSGSGTIKVTGIKYEIKNGLSDELPRYLAKIFVKNMAGTRCLNQQNSGTCDDSYAEFFLTGVPSGKVLTNGKDFSDADYTTLMGRFLIVDNGYDPQESRDDDFTVFIYLYDENGGMIGGKTISTFKTINPT